MFPVHAELTEAWQNQRSMTNDRSHDKITTLSSVAAFVLAFLTGDIQGSAKNKPVTCDFLCKPCPHCHRKVRLSHKSATVADNGETTAKFGDCRTFLRQCGQALIERLQIGVVS